MSVHDKQNPRDNQFLICWGGELFWHAKTRVVLIAQYATCNHVTLKWLSPCIRVNHDKKCIRIVPCFAKKVNPEIFNNFAVFFCCTLFTVTFVDVVILCVVMPYACHYPYNWWKQCKSSVGWTESESGRIQRRGFCWRLSCLLRMVIWQHQLPPWSPL